MMGIVSEAQSDGESEEKSESYRGRTIEVEGGLEFSTSARQIN